MKDSKGRGWHPQNCPARHTRGVLFSAPFYRRRSKVLGRRGPAGRDGGRGRKDWLEALEEQTEWEEEDVGDPKPGGAQEDEGRPPLFASHCPGLSGECWRVTDLGQVGVRGSSEDRPWGGEPWPPTWETQGQGSLSGDPGG